MALEKQNQRVSARVPQQVYDILAQAAEVTGATINQFLVQSAYEKAQKVIEDSRFIVISMKSSKAFFDTLENPPEPDQKLVDAVRVYERSFKPSKGTGQAKD